MIHFPLPSQAPPPPKKRMPRVRVGKRVENILHFKDTDGNPVDFSQFTGLKLTITCGSYNTISYSGLSFSGDTVRFVIEKKSTRVGRCTAIIQDDSTFTEDVDFIEFVDRSCKEDVSALPNQEIYVNEMTVSAASITTGAPGKSAYEIAVDNGFEGTEQEWLDSLHGDTGVSVSSLSFDTDGAGTTHFSDGGSAPIGGAAMSPKAYTDAQDTAIRTELVEVREIAEGAAVAVVFDTEQQLNDWLAGDYEREDGLTPADLKKGQHLLVEELGVPDYWWTGTGISELETQKVDLSDYYNKEQADLRFVLKSDFESLQDDFEALSDKSDALDARVAALESMLFRTLTYSIAGDEPFIHTETYERGVTVTLKTPEDLGVEIPEGYEFSGWTVDGVEATEVTLDANTTVTGEIVEAANDFVEINGLLWAKENTTENAQWTYWTFAYYDFDTAQTVAASLGLRLPTKDEFVALTALGSTWDDVLVGRWFGYDHELKGESTQSIFINARGVFSPDMDGFLAVGSNGCCWSATPNSATRGYGLDFSSGNVNPSSTSNRADGFNIRCVKDK